MCKNVTGIAKLAHQVMMASTLKHILKQIPHRNSINCENRPSRHLIPAAVPMMLTSNSLPWSVITRRAPKNHVSFILEYPPGQLYEANRVVLRSMSETAHYDCVLPNAIASASINSIPANGER
jgi:hypothetical protein